MRILALSDEQVPFIYSPTVGRRFSSIDLIIGCGDLAYSYLEYVYNALDVPLYYVRGNHDAVVEYGTVGRGIDLGSYSWSGSKHMHWSENPAWSFDKSSEQRTSPHGGVDLHRRVVHTRGLLLAGIEGSARYRPGPYQYSQAEMWRHALWIAPRLLLNRMIHGRTLDILITHAPPTGIAGADDGSHSADHPHRGIHAFQWLDQVFRPKLHLHGHIHLYSPKQAVEARIGATRVINTFRFQELEISIEKND